MWRRDGHLFLTVFFFPGVHHVFLTAFECIWSMVVPLPFLESGSKLGNEGRMMWLQTQNWLGNPKSLRILQHRNTMLETLVCLGVAIQKTAWFFSQIENQKPVPHRLWKFDLGHFFLMNYSRISPLSPFQCRKKHVNIGNLRYVCRYSTTSYMKKNTFPWKNRNIICSKFPGAPSCDTVLIRLPLFLGLFSSFFREEPTLRK